MFTRTSSLRAWPIIAQVLLGLSGIAAASLYPPTDGAIALVALDGRDAARLVAPAVERGAMPMGRGPLSNVLVIEGRRDRVALDMLKQGVLTIAAPRSWCGAAKASA